MSLINGQPWRTPRETLKYLDQNLLFELPVVILLKNIRLGFKMWTKIKIREGMLNKIPVHGRQTNVFNKSKKSKPSGMDFSSRYQIRSYFNPTAIQKCKGKQ